LKELVGKPLDGLSLKQRSALTGKWVALQVYTPETLPLRTIEALGESARDCIRDLRARGFDISQFEFTLLRPPY